MIAIALRLDTEYKVVLKMSFLNPKAIYLDFKLYCENSKTYFSRNVPVNNTEMRCEIKRARGTIQSNIWSLTFGISSGIIIFIWKYIFNIYSAKSRFSKKYFFKESASINVARITSIVLIYVAFFAAITCYIKNPTL